MFKDLLVNYGGKHSDEELVRDFRNGMENEVIAYVYEHHRGVFHQTAGQYKGVDESTVVSCIVEQIWKCFNNYDSSKSKGKITTMICKYIRNDLRAITQSNNYAKRAINTTQNCSFFSEFETGQDRIEEASELASYDAIELVDMIQHENLTDNERKYCLAAVKNLEGLTMARIADQIGISRAGAKRVRESLQLKLGYLLG